MEGFRLNRRAGPKYEDRNIYGEKQNYQLDNYSDRDDKNEPKICEKFPVEVNSIMSPRRKVRDLNFRIGIRSCNMRKTKAREEFKKDLHKDEQKAELASKLKMDLEVPKLIREFYENPEWKTQLLKLPEKSSKKSQLILMGRKLGKIKDKKVVKIR